MQYYNYTADHFAWPSKELYSLLPSNMQVINVNFGYRSAEITLSNGHLTVSKTFGSRPVEKARNKLSEPVKSIDFSDEYINTHYVINEEVSKRCFVNKFDVP